MSVVRFPGVTKLPLDPNLVLEGAMDELTEVLVLGWEHNGAFRIAASEADLGNALVLLKRAELYIIDRIRGMEPDQ